MTFLFHGARGSCEKKSEKEFIQIMNLLFDHSTSIWNTITRTESIEIISVLLTNVDEKISYL